MADKAPFDIDLVKSYPRSNKKIVLEVKPYGLSSEKLPDSQEKGQTTFISPFGVEFHAPCNYPAGTLLKINISIPDYWMRKQRYVDYTRIDTPEDFKILAKVVNTEDIGKRGKKKLILCQTVNIDEVDEQVLKAYLQDGK